MLVADFVRIQESIVWSCDNTSKKRDFNTNCPLSVGMKMGEILVVIDLIDGQVVP